MNLTPAISVIVPVYNAENYIHRCVDSFLSQRFNDFELILVDDGSPDKSGNICDEYAKIDDRVKVIHKNNGGVSSARQCGLDNALGEYIIHADPDDWVETEMLEKLYEEAKKENADMVICDYIEERNGKQKYIKQEPSALDHETVLKELFQQLHGSCCNKLVRRSCFNLYNIKFPNLIYCEDLFVNIMLLKNPLIVRYLDMAFYHYDRSINTNSITMNICNRRNIYYKVKAFYHELINNIDSQKYKKECIAMEFRLAFTAITARVFSSKEYVDSFKELKLYTNQNIKTCSPWEKFMVVISLNNFYHIAVILVELRHFIGNIKRSINQFLKKDE